MTGNQPGVARGDEIPGPGPGRFVRIPPLLVEIEGGQRPVGTADGDYDHGQQHHQLDERGQNEQTQSRGQPAVASRSKSGGREPEGEDRHYRHEEEPPRAAQAAVHQPGSQ